MSAVRTIVFLGVNASYSHSSLAAWCLRGFVNREKWRWQLVEATVGDDVHDVLGRIGTCRPTVLAATLYLFNRDFTLAALRLHQALAPECVVIVGGPECLGDNHALFQGSPGIDVAVRGEGELAWAELLRRFETRDTWRDIPGLCTLIAGRYVDGGQGALLENLDDIPPFYDEYLADFRKPFVQIETSRGCSNACSFCTSSNGRVRLFSLERVRADLAVIRRKGIREVRVVDRTFNETPQRCLALLRMFRDDFPELRFHLEIDPARMSAAMAAELAEAEPGRFHIEAGVQSLSAKVYRGIGRKATVPRTWDGLKRLCARRNLAIHVDLMAGLPGGTLDDVQKEVRALAALGPADIQLERLKLLPGTQLDREKAQWGIVAASLPPYEVLQTPDMSSDDLTQADRLSKLIDWFYNVSVLQAVVFDASRALADFWAALEARVGEACGFGTCPSLEHRFRLLDALLAGRSSPLVHRLRYAWLRHGFSARHGLCPARPWKMPVPQNAVLVEGRAAAAISRVWLAELEARYLFAYGASDRGTRGVVAVWRLPEEEGPGH
jgi:radical SAM superfamily enzyme YgiQ (UPF0313 family)